MRMFNTACTSGLLAFLTLTLLQSGAASQDAKPQSHPYDSAPPETVVVTGHRPAEKSLKAVVWKFVYAHATYSPKIDQLTRWVDPVCPVVRNLPPGFDQFIIARIKAIAASVGAPVKDDCTPNIEIIFTARPQTVMDGVAENDPRLLGYHFVHDTKKAAQVTQPIQAWYVTATSNEIETYLDDPYHGTPSGAPGRLSHGLLSVFSHVLILANTDVLVGRPIGPVADYLAVLALSRSHAEDDCVQLPSILDLLSDDCPEKPESLTIADKAYLEGLYLMDKKQIGSLQRSNISEHMVRSLKDE
jgi:hypothetical protein